jgi:hypothetical protein
LLAQRLKARPVFVRRLPVDRKAAHLSREMVANPQLWEAAMTAYHFAGHRSMLVDFLDALGIAHKEGHYEMGASPDPPAADALEGAVHQLSAKYRPTDVAVYLGALVIQDPRFWANLRPIAERMLSETETGHPAAGAE